MSWTQGRQRDYSDDNRGNYKYTNGHPNRKDYNPNTRDSANSRNDNRRNQEQVVAATFTQEGLATFSDIFGSAVEKAIEKELPNIVRQAVEESIERKMVDAFRLLKNEILSDLVDQLSHTRILEIERAVAMEEAAATSLQDTEDNEAVIESTANAKSTPEVNTGDSDADAVITLLHQMGRPLKLDEIKTLLPNVNWGSNPSVKMSRFVKLSQGQVKRAGKGLYEYVTNPKTV